MLPLSRWRTEAHKTDVNLVYYIIYSIELVLSAFRIQDPGLESLSTVGNRHGGSRPTDGTAQRRMHFVEKRYPIGKTVTTYGCGKRVELAPTQMEETREACQSE